MSVTGLTPLPSVHARDAIHVFEHRSCERPTQDIPVGSVSRATRCGSCLRESLSAVPESHSEGQLLANIPRRGHQGNRGQEGALGETDGEASDSKASGALDDGEQNCRDRPAQPET